MSQHSPAHLEKVQGGDSHADILRRPGLYQLRLRKRDNLLSVERPDILVILVSGLKLAGLEVRSLDPFLQNLEVLDQG